MRSHDRPGAVSVDARRDGVAARRGQPFGLAFLAVAFFAVAFLVVAFLAGMVRSPLRGRPPRLADYILQGRFGQEAVSKARTGSSRAAVTAGRTAGR
jgi:hypothetical protein